MAVLFVTHRQIPLATHTQETCVCCFSNPHAERRSRGGYCIHFVLYFASSLVIVYLFSSPSLFDGIAGSSIYEVISRYRVAQPASFQKSKAYKEQINPFYESSVDSDVDENEHEDVQLSLF